MSGTELLSAERPCGDDWYCGQCDDCLTGEHPENRPRMAPATGTVHACDWPGCTGQCHTGSTCPCHPLGAD